jgi:hypothetical protein
VGARSPLLLPKDKMPSWLHNRADHILSKNPSMPKSEAFAIATQQSHATGHTPKGYGTASGRAKAKKKYPHPEAYVQTANPSSKEKSSGMDLPLLKGFTDEVQKISAVFMPKPSRAPLNQPTPVSDPNQIQTLPATAAGNNSTENVR